MLFLIRFSLIVSELSPPFLQRCVGMIYSWQQQVGPRMSLFLEMVLFFLQILRSLPRGLIVPFLLRTSGPRAGTCLRYASSNTARTNYGRSIGGTSWQYTPPANAIFLTHYTWMPEINTRCPFEIEASWWLQIQTLLFSYCSSPPTSAWEEGSVSSTSKSSISRSQSSALSVVFLGFAPLAGLLYFSFRQDPLFLQKLQTLRQQCKLGL